MKVLAADTVTKGKKGKSESKEMIKDAPTTSGTSCAGSDGKPVCWFVV